MRGYERFIEPQKKELFSGLPTGRILEIGPGVGANFSYLPAGCEWWGFEPNTFMHKELETTAAEYREIDFHLHCDSAEALPVETNSVDAVIGTLVLCSVREPQTCLSEVLRVLKPGGRYFFIEHVAAPKPSWRRRLQSLAFYPWRFLADGCCTNRDLARAIQNAGFESIEIEHFSVPSPPMPPFLTPHISGWAQK